MDWIFESARSTSLNSRAFTIQRGQSVGMGRLSSERSLSSALPRPIRIHLRLRPRPPQPHQLLQRSEPERRAEQRGDGRHDDFRDVERHLRADETASVMVLTVSATAALQNNRPMATYPAPASRTFRWSSARRDSVQTWKDVAPCTLARDLRPPPSFGVGPSSGYPAAGSASPGARESIPATCRGVRRLSTRCRHRQARTGHCDEQPTSSGIARPQQPRQGRPSRQQSAAECQVDLRTGVREPGDVDGGIGGRERRNLIQDFV